MKLFLKGQHRSYSDYGVICTSKINGAKRLGMAASGISQDMISRNGVNPFYRQLFSCFQFNLIHRPEKNSKGDL